MELTCHVKPMRKNAGDWSQCSEVCLLGAFETWLRGAL